MRWVAGSRPDATLQRHVTEYLSYARDERRPASLPPRLTWAQRRLIGLLRRYQTHLSGRLGRTCIYEPSCSDYAILTVAYNGTITGTFDALRRWVRCRPSSKGGVDYPRGCRIQH